MNARSWLFVLGPLALVAAVSTVRAQPTLAEALDATNLVWSTDGTGGVKWAGEAATLGNNTVDDEDSARSGHIGPNSETWIQTTVVGPGLICFWWMADSEPYGDWLEFYIGSTLHGRISGATMWEFCSFPVPAGTNLLRWRYVKDDAYSGGWDCGWVDRVRYVTPLPPPVQQSLGTCGVTWSTLLDGNDLPNGWFAQTNVTHDGQWAAQSVFIPNDQAVALQTTVSGVTNVSFWWKVSSEAGFDFLEFYTNGVLARQISGEVGWTSNYFKLSSKTNTLAWAYRKDSWGSAGSDCGWLDQVAFSPTLKALPYTLQSPTRLPDGRIQLSVTGEAGCPCRVEYSTNVMNSAAWTAFTNLTTPAATTAIIEPSSASSPLRYYRTVSP